jgi:hypothetical protein
MRPSTVHRRGHGSFKKLPYEAWGVFLKTPMRPSAVHRMGPESFLKASIA